MTNVIRVLPFGGCGSHLPLFHVAKTNPSVVFAKVGNFQIPVAFSIGEALQLISFLRGERDVPQELRGMACIRPNFQPLPNLGNFENADVILVEPATPIEINFRSFFLNRSGVVVEVTRPIAAVSQHAHRRTSVWWNQGLNAMNEKIQLEVAEELISLMPPDMPNPELAKAVLREARVHLRDVKEGLAEFLRLIGDRPVGVVVYVHSYFPDGRVISMPDGYREHTIEAATELGLPYLDPSIFVQRHGVQSALRPDLRHYTDDFNRIMGDALLDFARSIYGGSREFGLPNEAAQEMLATL
jgi:hypothetical protein